MCVCVSILTFWWFSDSGCSRGPIVIDLRLCTKGLKLLMRITKTFLMMMVIMMITMTMMMMMNTAQVWRRLCVPFA